MLRRTAGAIVVALILTACIDSGDPTSPNPADGRRSSIGSMAASTGQRIDPLEELAAQIPGFGGLYLEPDTSVMGNLAKSRIANVYLTEGGDGPAADRSVRSFLARNRIQLGDVRILQASHTFTQLSAWKSEIKDVLSRSGVVMLDLDEAGNDLFVGVLDDAAQTIVRSFLETKNIPRDVVRTGHVSPIRLAATLRDYRRPIEGGREINSGGICTLGFNASLAGSFTFASEGDRTFVTASHCTDTQGGVEQTAFYQGGGFIGTELRDPDLFTGGACPANRQCRYSDAAMIDYDSLASWDPAAVARVSSGITISTTQPTVIFYSEAVAVVNQYVGKIGRTTGHTWGPVTATCFDGNVVGSSVTILCQAVSRAQAGPGDSGSPALAYFYLYPLLPNSALGADLYGVTWGGFADTAFIYSPISAVRSELGTFGAICFSSWFC